MYQAQQEAELGELQNQENVKNIFQSVRLQLFFKIVRLETLKTKGRAKQRTVLVFSVEN